MSSRIQNDLKTFQHNSETYFIVTDFPYTRPLVVDCNIIRVFCSSNEHTFKCLFFITFYRITRYVGSFLFYCNVNDSRLNSKHRFYEYKLYNSLIRY